MRKTELKIYTVARKFSSFVIKQKDSSHLVWYKFEELNSLILNQLAEYFNVDVKDKFITTIYKSMHLSLNLKISQHKNTLI